MYIWQRHFALERRFHDGGRASLIPAATSTTLFTPISTTRPPGTCTASLMVNLKISESSAMSSDASTVALRGKDKSGRGTKVKGYKMIQGNQLAMICHAVATLMAEMFQVRPMVMLWQ